CGNSGVRKNGGVRRHAPGSLLGIYGTVVLAPSLLRQFRISTAVISPTIKPSSRLWLGGRFMRNRSIAASNAAFWLGYKSVRHLNAAPTAAASVDASGAAFTRTRYCL